MNKPTSPDPLGPERDDTPLRGQSSRAYLSALVPVRFRYVNKTRQRLELGNTVPRRVEALRRRCLDIKVVGAIIDDRKGVVWYLDSPYIQAQSPPKSGIKDCGGHAVEG